MASIFLIEASDIEVIFFVISVFLGTLFKLDQYNRKTFFIIAHHAYATFVRVFFKSRHYPLILNWPSFSNNCAICSKSPSSPFPASN